VASGCRQLLAELEIKLDNTKEALPAPSCLVIAENATLPEKNASVGGLSLQTPCVSNNQDYSEKTSRFITSVLRVANVLYAPYSQCQPNCHPHK
jgi:hypothetical protein